MSLGTTGAAVGPPALEGLPLGVLRRSLSCIRHFRHELDSLRSAYAEREDLPGLRTLVDAMSALLAETEREVVIRSRELHEALVAGRRRQPAEERFCDLANGLVNALDRVFPSLLQMTREPHGREIEALIVPYTELLGHLHQQEPHSIELIFRPGEEYSFELSVIDQLIKIADPFTDDLRQLLYGFPRLIAVTYPKQREADILIHSMIAHEIAHTVLDYVPPGDEEAPIIHAFDRAVTDHYDALLTAIGGEGEEEERRRRADSAIQHMKRWFEELSCDALALGMIGPAYVFALADFDLTPNNFTQIPGTASFDTHPGLAWRLRRTISRAEREYFAAAGARGPASSSLLAAMQALLAELPANSVEEISAEERELVEVALDNLDGEAIAAVLRQARYLRTYFSEEIELVWEKLDAGIPPAERVNERGHFAACEPKLDQIPEKWSHPMEWQSILNGAFAYWLAGKPLRPDRPERTFPDRRRIAQDWIDFNSYVRGSVELANLHGQLRDARDRLEGLNEPKLKAR